MSRIFGLLFILVVLLAGIAFHLHNDQPVTLDFYSGAVALPFSLWVLLSLTVGALLGLLACLPSLVRGRLQIGRLRRRLQALEPRDDQKPAPPGGSG